MTTTKFAPAWARSQHWRIDGFRITVLVYNSGGYSDEPPF